MKKGPYKCRYCVLSYDTHQHRGQHETNAHQNREYIRKEMRDPLFYCPECQKPYMTLGATQRHAMLSHGLSASEVNRMLDAIRPRQEVETTRPLPEVKSEKRKKETRRSNKKLKKEIEIEEDEDDGNESEKSVIEIQEDGQMETTIENTNDILYASMSGLMPTSTPQIQQVAQATAFDLQKQQVVQPNVMATQIMLPGTSTQSQTMSAVVSGRFIQCTMPVRNFYVKKSQI